MKKTLLLITALAAGLTWPADVAAQKLVKPLYMQIFYQGAGWLTGQPLLHYSPAFRGKTEEIVREDSTRLVSPGALVFDAPAESTVHQSALVSVSTDEGTFVPDGKGKMRLQTSTDIQQDQLAEKARFSRGLNLLNARTNLAHNTLTKALNEAAADGWEVVQVATIGSGGGLVYLLRRR